MQHVNSHSVSEHCPEVLAEWPNSTRPSDAEWSLVDCARVLYRRRSILLSVVAVGILGAAIVSALQTPMYQSRDSIQIQGLNDNFLSLRDVYPTAAPAPDNAVYIQTQAEILRQDALLEQVVRKLQLDQRPEFRPSWSPFHLGGASTTIDEVRDNVVILPSRGSSIIQIVCEAIEPKLAADLANTLAQSFIEQTVETRQQAARQTQAALSIERDALGRRLLQSEAEFDLRERGTASYNALKREIEANRQYYRVIAQRIDEARVASAMSQSNVRLVSPARPAARPYKPNLVLNLAIALIGALIGAIGFVMLREQTSSSLRAPGQASAYLAIPELGAIPKVGNRWLSPFRLGRGFHASPLARVSAEHSSSGWSESFRAATASILATASNGDHPHVLVVTSPRHGEGKTTVVSNLAIALAQIGGKVLLIDGDLRHPRLHEIFDQANSWGLSDLLREKNGIEELPLETFVKRTALPRLFLLPGGTAAENIFALLWSGRMARLLARYRHEFDYVLIDSPPSLDFADARILGRYADKLILVVRADFTDKATARAAVQRLMLDGIPIMGVIFNCWDSKCDIYDHTRYRQEAA